MGKKENEIVLQGCAAFVLALIVFPVVFLGLCVYEGWVLVQLWDWFVLEYFQVPALTIPLAIGLVLTIRLVTQQVPPKEQGNVLVFLFLRPIVMLGLGWIIHTYFMN